MSQLRTMDNARPRRSPRRATHGSLGLALAVSLLGASSGMAAPTSTPAPVTEPAPCRCVRKGFSLELGFGAGVLYVSGLDRYGDKKSDWGFEPHAISLGGFLTHDLALFFRWKSTYHNARNATGKLANRFVGTQTANLQWWFQDRWFFGGGAGLAIFGFGFGSRPSDPGWSFGGALDGRLGVALAAWKHHLIVLSYEVVVGLFRHGVAVGQTLNIGYQYY